MHIKQKTPRGSAGPSRHVVTDDAPRNNGVARNRQEVFQSYQLDLFGSRCAELVQRVNFGTIGFIDAVDMAWSAAIWSGIVDNVGPDAVQEIMRTHFMGARR
jgi:hypothetical protein